MLLVDLQIAARNLTRHTRRSLFLGGALAAVTGLLILLSALTAGIEGAMMESATTLMTGDVNVGGFFKVTAGSAAPLVSDYPRVLEATRKAVPEIDYLVVRGRGWAKAVSETGSMDLVLGGVEIDEEPGVKKVLQPIQGKLDDLLQPNTILLFQGQAERLKVGVGDMLTLAAPTERGVNNTADVKVAVVVKNVGLLSGFSAFIPAGSLNRLYGISPTTTGAIHLYLKDRRASDTVAVRLRALFKEQGWRVMEPDPQPYYMKLFLTVPASDWTGQQLDVTTWADELGNFKQIIFGLKALTFLLVFLLMVVVIIGILNTMAIAIRERTREIGTLRAIGMQRRKVLWLFVLEMGLLGTLGCALGAVLATLVAGGLNLARIRVPAAVEIFLSQEHLHFRLEPA
ncbi:MAG: FtsX-like permease family protein, partial [Anaeromyxobacteraceae bacterium]|nr:FtsX-like permease family protein [Anaeromyxobacteraceae bacterium]